MATADASERYKLSFGVGGLYLQGAPIAARLYGFVNLIQDHVTA